MQRGKNQPLNMNYRHVCEYCGKNYESNRSNSKYCCDQHRALAHAQRLKNSIPKKEEGGVITEDYHALLSELYNDRSDLGYNDGWSVGFPADTLRKRRKYFGPLPVLDEMIIIDGYAIRRRTSELDSELSINSYSIKPVSLLTEEDLNYRRK